MGVSLSAPVTPEMFMATTHASDSTQQLRAVFKRAFVEYCIAIENEWKRSISTSPIDPYQVVSMAKRHFQVVHKDHHTTSEMA